MVDYVTSSILYIKADRAWKERDCLALSLQ